MVHAAHYHTHITPSTLPHTPAYLRSVVACAVACRSSANNTRRRSCMRASVAASNRGCRPSPGGGRVVTGLPGAPVGPPAMPRVRRPPPGLADRARRVCAGCWVIGCWVGGWLIHMCLESSMYMDVCSSKHTTFTIPCCCCCCCCCV